MIENLVDLKKESIFISLKNSDRLHLQHFWTSLDGPPVLMIHGAIENGRIFYSQSLKGFACFLAKRGFDVYVGDLRGRGLSQPPISSKSQFGQTESIVEDIPKFAEEIQKRRGNVLQYWIAHSWGGVLLLSSLARFPNLRNLVKAMVFFGTKRRVQAQNIEKWLKIDFFWKNMARLLTWKFGYLPAKELGIGSDNESRLSHSQSVDWVKLRPWVDSMDGFDYGKEIKKAILPPSLYLAGAKDYSLGNPWDVKQFIKETGSESAEYWLLPKFGHIDMLTSASAEQEIFPHILRWMGKERSSS